MIEPEIDTEWRYLPTQGNLNLKLYSLWVAPFQSGILLFGTRVYFSIAEYSEERSEFKYLNHLEYEDFHSAWMATLVYRNKLYAFGIKDDSAEIPLDGIYLEGEKWE